MENVASSFENVPEALTARDQWVCWRREERDGKATKVPVEPATGDYASTIEPDTWTDVATALDAVDTVHADGVGFVFTDDDSIVGIDLDDCRDPSTRTIDEWARDIVTRLDSYAEVSPSGTGIHVIAEGELPAGRSRRGDVEMYERGRFFTVTGEHLDVTPQSVERRVDAIHGVHADYVQTSQEDDEEDANEVDGVDSPESDIGLDDQELLERARAAENGDRFAALWRGETSGYDSHSEADMALCLHLAFWTGGDRSRMDELFRQSELMREKWDEVHYADGATYGERTIERALELVDDVYNPDRESGREAVATRSGGESTASDSASQAFPEVRGSETESVYLAERNRLLREKVQSQAATLERQRDRIAQLEDELRKGGDQEANVDTLQGESAEDGGGWSRFLSRLRNR